MLVVVLFWELLIVSEPLPLIVPDNSALTPLPSMVFVPLALAGVVKTRLAL